ncbi:MAG: hypothetical protein QOK01_1309, partial [Alphaproteobacteria bacterium]|nr:hypothetical protein [Alphaproteobacteria bacterium]
QQAEQKDVAAKCSHRDISHTGGSEGTASERLEIALYPSAQSGNNPRKNGQAALRGVYCGRKDGVSPSRPRNVVSKTAQAKDMAVEAQGRNHSRHRPPHPFFRKGGAMAGEHRQAAQRRRIRGRRSGRLSDAVLREKERSPMSAPPKSAIALLRGKSVAPMLENPVWANVLKAGRQPATHPIAVQI